MSATELTLRRLLPLARKGLSEWDMAAGALLIQEAGGLVSDFTGGHDFLEKGHIVAGNTKCFKAVLTAIQPHLPASLKR